MERETEWERKNFISVFPSLCCKTLKFLTFCHKTLKYVTFCREMLKYGECRKNLNIRAMRKWFWIKSGCEEACIWVAHSWSLLVTAGHCWSLLVIAGHCGTLSHWTLHWHTGYFATLAHWLPFMWVTFLPSPTWPPCVISANESESDSIGSWHSFTIHKARLWSPNSTFWSAIFSTFKSAFPPKVPRVLFKVLLKAVS